MRADRLYARCMKRIIYYLLAVLLPLQIGSIVQAKIEAEENAPETVTIPFSPPLAVDLVYDVTRSRLSSDAQKVSTMRQKIRFEKAGDGYVMAVTPISATSGGGSIVLSQKIEDMKVSDVFKESLYYDLASDGTIIRMRNWDVIQEELIASFGDSVVDQKVAVVFSRMSSEQAGAAILKDWVAVLGYGGAELEIGSEYECETTIPFSGIPVPATGTFQLTKNAPDNALRLIENTSMKNENPDEKIFRDFEKLMDGLFDEDESKRLQFEQTMQQLKRIKIENSTDIQFEAETGMPIETSVSSIITLEEGELLETITTIKRIVE